MPLRRLLVSETSRLRTHGSVRKASSYGSGKGLTHDQRKTAALAQLRRRIPLPAGRGLTLPDVGAQYTRLCPSSPDSSAAACLRCDTSIAQRCYSAMLRYAKHGKGLRRMQVVCMCHHAGLSCSKALERDAPSSVAGRHGNMQLL